MLKMYIFKSRSIRVNFIQTGNMLMPFNWQKCSIHMLKMGHSRTLFPHFRLFFTVGSKQMFYIKVCQLMYSNRRPLVLDTAALPTEPQPLPTSSICYLRFRALFLLASGDRPKTNLQIFRLNGLTILSTCLKY